MLAHLMVVLIGFGLFWFVHTRTTLEPKSKLIYLVIIVGLTIGGLIIDAPTDCKPASLVPTGFAPTPRLPAPTAVPETIPSAAKDSAR